MSSPYAKRAVPFSERGKVRSDAKPEDVQCVICGQVVRLLAHVAKNRKTCGNKACTAEIKRRNAKSQAGSIRERFESKLVKRDSGCWEWTGRKNKGGYGAMVVNGKSLRAHRLAFQIYSKPLGDDQLACHHCDNPSCVNPDHLYAGTPQSNADDKVARGRCHRPKYGPEILPGETNAISKLSDDAVRKIRELHKSGSATNKHIAEIFEVSPSLISKVVNGHIWRHVEDDA